ncbi:2909_t:CDS:2 [Paraglomus occultum]|uniref:2909_t:CDS:1 n=1 Tax=Paraglomus occultum TaxID=144539 RepID=A0A9N9C4W0_9GLOM|nr:2909_t:CDS:2 [Paraglomus occultum]
MFEASGEPKVKGNMEPDVASDYVFIYLVKTAASLESVIAMSSSTQVDSNIPKSNMHAWPQERIGDNKNTWERAIERFFQDVYA